MKSKLGNKDSAIEVLISIIILLIAYGSEVRAWYMVIAFCGFKILVSLLMIAGRRLGGIDE